MPSLVITVNNTNEIRVNLPRSSSKGVHLNWIAGDNKAEDGLICFSVGGVEGEENISYVTPDLSIGDEIVITISLDPVIDSANSRTPYNKLAR